MEGKTEAMALEQGRAFGTGQNSFMDILIDEKYFKWLLISPLILVLIIFMIYPLLYCIYYSFHNYNMVRDAVFVGFENYRFVLKNDTFWRALGNTTYILVISIAVELIVAMAIAMLFNRKFRGQDMVRGLCLLPLLISPLAMSMIWNFMLQFDFGVVNQFLNQFGLKKVMWWSPGMALNTIVFISIWQWTPFSIFVLLSGLRGLPKEPFEAAAVDGARPLYIFWRLTLRMLSPLIVIIVLLRTMWLIRVFDPLYGTTRGGVNTETLDWMLYRVSFVYFNVGRGSTLAIISLYMTIAICAIMFKVLMKSIESTNSKNG
jgi:multiple sugar transport system permease protein